MRGTRLCLRPQALRANLARARELAQGMPVVAMVKANGYGHGLVLAARAFAVADRLGVAVMDEARQLRDAGIGTPILVAEGCFDADEVREARALKDVAVVVHSVWQAEQLLATQVPLEVWLKLDSGMHRLGMPADVLRDQYRRLSAAGVPVTTVMTHLACADKPEDHLSAHQLDACRALAQELGLRASMANSAALIRHADSRAGAVRPGILLYGSSPFADQSAAALGLQVTQTLTARLIAINPVATGESVGYGSRWQAMRPSRIGVVAVGYGDGYPRHAPNGTPVAVTTPAGVMRAPLAGCVSMDMITIDLTDMPQAQVGDPVELWGDHVGIDEVARAAGTISYELFCQVTDRPERHTEA